MTDEDRLRNYAEELATQIEHALPGWVRRAAQSRLTADQQSALSSEIDMAAADATQELGSAARRLLGQDIDQQRTTPLAIIREAVKPVNAVLGAAGVAEVGRDVDARRLHPDDVYDLTPGSYLDLGPDVQDASLMWGAAKAHIHIQRRKAEGMS